MSLKKLLVSSMLMSQIVSAESWLIDIKDDPRFLSNPSRSVVLHRKLKHTKLSANDLDPHVVHLRIAIDEFLDEPTPVRISVEGDKIRLENKYRTRLVSLPFEVKPHQDSYTFWYMQHGEHGPNKHYSRVELPATFELKR